MHASERKLGRNKNEIKGKALNLELRDGRQFSIIEPNKAIYNRLSLSTKAEPRMDKLRLCGIDNSSETLCPSTSSSRGIDLSWV